jgi:uncharacterized repeat protein (TIGR03803 family)
MKTTRPGIEIETTTPMQRHITDPSVPSALAAWITIFVSILAADATAQTFATLHSFGSPPDYGGNPWGNVIACQNTLYGTTYTGGTNGVGSVFAVNSNGTGFVDVYSFSGGADGGEPRAGLAVSGNTLYGTTYAPYSGARLGTVFKVNTDGTSFATLHTFDLSDGFAPYGGVIVAGNTLYGTTWGGGANNDGIIFAVNTDGTGFTNLYSFGAPDDGAAPLGGLVLSGNTLYGTTENGSGGTIFQINTDGTGYRILTYFDNGSGVFDGPDCTLAVSGNVLYGAATDGGSPGTGTIFSVNTDGTGFTTLHTFAYAYENNNEILTNSDGAGPDAGVIVSGSTLYGSTYGGGTNGNGTVFTLNIDGTGFKVLYTFTPGSINSDGANPSICPLALLGNTLYGTALDGGLLGDGTVFSLVLAPQPRVTTLVLPGGTNGLPYSQQLAAAYGQPPYTWSLISGSLPLGLSLATNGMISGTPTGAGPANFTVEVTDALSRTATQPLTLMVWNPPTIVIELANQYITVMGGATVSLSVSAMGMGYLNYQWQLNGTNLPSGIITTVAGNWTYGYSGDGDPATAAALNGPRGVAVDTAGNLFIADMLNNRIRKVDANGIITTVAGNGTGSYAGDGGAATNAELWEPTAVAVDTKGNLFIVDQGTLIRKVDVNGIITTVAGTPLTWGYAGDGGPATAAQLNEPYGVAVDANDNIFIADTDNNRIRRLNTNGIITTVAGNGNGGYSGDGGTATAAELNGPFGVAVDAAGNLLIGDTDNNCIRRVGTNGIITTVVGNGTGSYAGDGGAATNAKLNQPTGIAVSATGDLFIADYGNLRIREVGTNGIINTVAGDGATAQSGDGGMATNALVIDPTDVAVDSNFNLFVAQPDDSSVIRKVVLPLGPTLVLNDVGCGNSGVYDVVVSSPYGSVTSSVVHLTVTLSPFILSAPQMSVGNINFTFQLAGHPGSNYVLQSSANLLNWNSVSTSTVPASGSIILSNATTDNSRLFYRVCSPSSK